MGLSHYSSPSNFTPHYGIITMMGWERPKETPTPRRAFHVCTLKDVRGGAS